MRRGFGSGPGSEAWVMMRAWVIFVVAVEVEGRVDERDVRESLREVADQAFAIDVVFLGEQAEVVAQGEQALEEALRIFGAADGFEAADHPEAAGQKYAFAGRQAVVDLGGVVAKDEAAGMSSRSMASMVALTRGSVPGRKPTRGMRSREASS